MTDTKKEGNFQSSEILSPPVRRPLPTPSIKKKVDSPNSPSVANNNSTNPISRIPPQRPRRPLPSIQNKQNESNKFQKPVPPPSHNRPKLSNVNIPLSTNNKEQIALNSTIRSTSINEPINNPIPSSPLKKVLVSPSQTKSNINSSSKNEQNVNNNKEQIALNSTIRSTSINEPINKSNLTLLQNKPIPSSSNKIKVIEKPGLPLPQTKPKNSRSFNEYLTEVNEKKSDSSNSNPIVKKQAPIPPSKQIPSIMIEKTLIEDATFSCFEDFIKNEKEESLPSENTETTESYNSILLNNSNNSEFSSKERIQKGASVSEISPNNSPGRTRGHMKSVSETPNLSKEITRKNFFNNHLLNTSLNKEEMRKNFNTQYAPQRTIIGWIPIDAVFDQGEREPIRSPQLYIPPIVVPTKKSNINYDAEDDFYFPGYRICTYLELQQEYRVKRANTEIVDWLKLMDEIIPSVLEEYELSKTKGRNRSSEVTAEERPIDLEETLPKEKPKSKLFSSSGRKNITVENSSSPLSFIKIRKAKTISSGNYRGNSETDIIAKYKAYFNISENTLNIEAEGDPENLFSQILLPPGWMECTSTKGETFYFNYITEQTTWQFPGTFSSSKQTKGEIDQSGSIVYNSILTKHNTVNLELSPYLKQKMIVEEICATEKTYVGGLQLIQDYYFKPLKEKKILNEEEIRCIFSNVQTLLNVSNQILEDLEKECILHDYNPNGLIIVFCKITPFLKMYISYLRDQPNSIQKVTLLSKMNKDFRAHCQAIKALPISKSLTLSDYLITPLQRLTRYPLLLSELLNCLEKNAPYYEPLSQVISQLKEVALKSNECHNQVYTYAKLLDLDSRFHRTINFSFIIPGRYLILEGEVLIQDELNKSGKETCFLFSDCMVFGVPKKNKLKLKRIFMLKDLQIIQKQTEQENKSLGNFHITIKDNEKTIHILFQSLDEQETWYQEITSSKEKISKDN